jgi:hypothetical protein
MSKNKIILEYLYHKFMKMIPHISQILVQKLDQVCF